MYKTYENFLPLAKIDLPDDECVLQYQKNQDPICLATIFVRHFPVLVQICNSFWGITSEDKASFCLEEIHKTLLSYSFDKKTKFVTFVYTYVKNRLQTETESLNTDKRKANYLQSRELDGKNTSPVQFNDLGDDGQIELEVIDKTNAFSDLEVLVAVRSSSLSTREKAYCEYAIKNTVHATDSDFAKQQNISSAAVHYIRESLQLKIGAILA